MALPSPVALLIRNRRWWDFIAPLPVAVAMATAALSGNFGLATVAPLLCFCLSLFLIGSFGFLLNDVFDVEADARVGKRNAAAENRFKALWLWCPTLVVCGLLPWWTVFAERTAANVLIHLQIALLIVYAAPPTRLKERGALGVVVDALYGHTLPALIAFLAFAPAPMSSTGSDLVLLGTAIVFLKGLRNILAHQLDDRIADKRAGIATYVNQHHAGAVLELVWKAILPTELLLLTTLLAMLAGALPLLLLTLICFLLVTVLRWRSSYKKSSSQRLWHLERYFLNLLYEGWIPTALLLHCMTQSPVALLLVALNLVLFPRQLSAALHPFRSISLREVY